MFRKATIDSFYADFRPSLEKVVTSSSGFCIEFCNGYKVSVQWGPGTYTDNHRERKRGPNFEWSSLTAEVMVHTSLGYYSYNSWQTEREVRAIIASISGLPDERESEEEEEYGSLVPCFLSCSCS